MEPEIKKCFLCTYAEILKVGRIKLHLQYFAQFFKEFEQPALCYRCMLDALGRLLCDCKGEFFP